MTIDEVMHAAPVIPVLVLDGTIDPVALAENVGRADWSRRSTGSSLSSRPSLAFPPPNILILEVN